MTHSVTSMYMCELVVKVSLIFVNKIRSTLFFHFQMFMFYELPYFSQSYEASNQMNCYIKLEEMLPQMRWSDTH